MTISDVLKTPEFYNNLKVVISDLENTRRNAGISANAPLKRHPIDRLQNHLLKIHIKSNLLTILIQIEVIIMFQIFVG